MAVSPAWHTLPLVLCMAAPPPLSDLCSNVTSSEKPSLTSLRLWLNMLPSQGRLRFLGLSFCFILLSSPYRPLTLHIYFTSLHVEYLSSHKAMSSDQSAWFPAISPGPLPLRGFPTVEAAGALERASVNHPGLLHSGPQESQGSDHPPSCGHPRSPGGGDI